MRFDLHIQIDPVSHATTCNLSKVTGHDLSFSDEITFDEEETLLHEGTPSTSNKLDNNIVKSILIPL